MSELPVVSARLVVDTNVILRGLVNSRSASGRVLELIDRHAAILLLSKPVLAEYRAVLSDPHVVERYPELTAENVQVSLRRLRYLGEVEHLVREHFEFPRDPRDSKLIELALAGKATHLVSADNDLLSLPTSHSEAAKRLRQRLPRLRIVRPAEFLEARSE